MSGPRLVPVVLDFGVLTGEQHPRPRVGDVGAFGLGFSEATEHTDPDDPTLCTVTAHVERLRDGRPWRRRRGGEEHGWSRWSNVLHGDGWTASWTSFRPPPDTRGDSGEVELRGHLCCDFSALTTGRVHGVIRRLWTVHSRRDVAADPERMETWPPAWGSTTLTAVDEMPMLAVGQPRPALPPGVTCTGLLAEIDPGTGVRAPTTHDDGGGVDRFVLDLRDRHGFGAPRDEEYPVTGGQTSIGDRAQDFEGGTIYLDTATGRVGFFGWRAYNPFAPRTTDTGPHPPGGRE